MERDARDAGGLPIDSLQQAFCAATVKGPVVLTAPTGSGKSTRVPVWCTGTVLVVQPRRLACRALAARVADALGTPLGAEVGYAVRDESRLTETTRVVFATPGVALRQVDRWHRYETVILDEFHERGLDTDLLLALLRKRFHGRLVVMSATLAADRVTAHLGGVHLHGEARTFPVTVKYLAAGHGALPDAAHLAARVRQAVEAAREDLGDILVFLPGKGEIAECAQALQSVPRIEVLTLHGDMSLALQRRVFEPGRTRRVVLATNVAETSLTLPGVGVVIDTGLVRQTRYREGRATLVRAAVAQDSADQRAGRSGRTGPGVCYRLWSPAARLAPVTLPEIYRESLVPMVLAAARWGESLDTLDLLDPPREPALVHARQALLAMGALDVRGAILPLGRELFGLPLDAHLGRLLIAARTVGALEDAIDLVAALSVGRPLFLPGTPGTAWESGEGLRGAGCDMTALVHAVRHGDADHDGLHRGALEEARRTAVRLRSAHGLPSDRAVVTGALDRARLARAAMAADPRCVHVARRRGRDVAWSNGGSELSLARDSAVASVRDVDAIAVLDSHAVGEGRDAEVFITCATPLAHAWLLTAGVGHDKLAAVTVERGSAMATLERVYAGKVLGTRDEMPVGDMAREAVATLFLRGSIFRDSLAVTRERLAAHALAVRLVAAGHTLDDAWRPGADGVTDLAAWTAARVAALGVSRGDDLGMLSAPDFIADDVPPAVRETLDREFPRRVTVGDATYAADYDLDARRVTLKMVKGARTQPPPLGYLPRFPGLKICVEAGRAMWVVRPHG